MKSINKKLMKDKLKNYKKYKERNKEHELDLNNQAPKYMANASFYYQSFDLCDRPAFKMNIYHTLGHFIVLDFLL